MKRLLTAPSPAMVVACAALAVSLGGVGYAAVRLPRNSVGTAQLKNGAVNSAKIRNFSLLRKDFKPGQIPRSVSGLVGPRGPAGPQGPQGPKGDTGPTGPPGVVLSSTGDDAVPLKFYSYYMDTTGSVKDYAFGQVKIETEGAGHFKICGNLDDSGAGGTPFPYVLYLNGVRSTGTVMSNACTSAYLVGASGDFEVQIRRALIFGVHSGDSPTSENYNLYGFSQL